MSQDDELPVGNHLVDGCTCTDLCYCGNCLSCYGDGGGECNACSTDDSDDSDDSDDD